MIRINEEFEAEQVAAFSLRRNGQPIVDEDGRIRYFPTLSGAVHVAEHWEDYRAPTMTELRAMSDAELSARIEVQRLGLAQ